MWIQPVLAVLELAAVRFFYQQRCKEPFPAEVQFAVDEVFRRRQYQFYIRILKNP